MVHTRPGTIFYKLTYKTVLFRGRQSKICFITLIWLREDDKKVVGSFIAKRKSEDKEEDENKEDVAMEDCEYMEVDEDEDEDMEVDIGWDDESSSR